MSHIDIGQPAMLLVSVTPVFDGCRIVISCCNNGSENEKCIENRIAYLRVPVIIVTSKECMTWSWIRNPSTFGLCRQWRRLCQSPFFPDSNNCRLYTAITAGHSVWPVRTTSQHQSNKRRTHTIHHHRCD